MRRLGIAVFVACVLVSAGAIVAAQDTAMFEGLRRVRVYVNANEVCGDVPAVILAGRTMVPLRVVAEELRAEVKWYPETGKVSIVALHVPNEAIYEQWAERFAGMFEWIPVTSVQLDSPQFAAACAKDVEVVNQLLDIALSMTPPAKWKVYHRETVAALMWARAFSELRLEQHRLIIEAFEAETLEGGLDTFNKVRRLVEYDQQWMSKRITASVNFLTTEFERLTGRKPDPDIFDKPLIP